MDTSSNPALSSGAISRISQNVESKQTMTVGGTLAKISWLLAVLFGTAAWSWNLVDNGSGNFFWLTTGASLAAFFVAMIVIFTKPNPILITLYAALEGVIIGSISFLFAEDYQGIVQQAVLLTLSITLGMLILYSLKLVKVTEKLKSIIFIATFGVAIFYFLVFLLGLFSDSVIDFAYNGTSGILIALFVVLIAALNLLLDFDFIDKGTQKKLPKQFEWYGAFSIMITIIWLYFSILRLLGSSRR